MTDMQRMIIDELLCKPRLLKGDGENHIGSNNVYMRIVNTGYNNLEAGDFYIQEAGAIGGAWWVIGTGSVYDDKIILELKTVHGIMFFKGETEQTTFPSCIPGFPDNVVSFIERAVLNAIKTRNLQSRRSNKRWCRLAREQQERDQIQSEKLALLLKNGDASS